jgi:hypothetical protein
VVVAEYSRSKVKEAQKEAEKSARRKQFQEVSAYDMSPGRPRGDGA